MQKLIKKIIEVTAYVYY